jgi:hypothetical protein
MSNKHGSLKAFSIEGISFAVPKDTKVKLSNSNYEVELKSNGPSEASVSFIAKEKTLEGVELSISLTEYVMICDWANDVDGLVGICATLIDNSMIKGQCKLSLGSWDSGDGKLDMKVLAPSGFTIITA